MRQLRADGRDMWREPLARALLTLALCRSNGFAVLSNMNYHDVEKTRIAGICATRLPCQFAQNTLYERYDSLASSN
jgi:hypothetical protein